MGRCVAQEEAGDMIEKSDCERCQRIKSAIDQGLSPDEAREANGWDECSHAPGPCQP
jgi:hypothetical protein